MEKILSDLEPKQVFHYFEEICTIPHGSGNMQAISDYCVEFARKHQLECFQDEALNVVIKKPASKGYENLPVLMIQGHLDMVCEKNADITFDFLKDGLRLIVEDGYVHADHTTLGGDDGIAVAMCLAILEDGQLAHPELEIVLTTEEETGMDGATHLNTDQLRAKYLLNLDSEDEGHILSGSAGGLKARAILPVDYTNFTGYCVDVRITGLKGGHSGIEIQEYRANANILMGRLLLRLHKFLNFGIADVNGGLKDNAIPREAFLRLIVLPDDMERFFELYNEIYEEIRHEYMVKDPDISFKVDDKKVMETFSVLTLSSMEKFIYLLFSCPNGIQTMSPTLAGLPESSLNLGVVKHIENTIEFCWSVRSSVKSLKELIADKLQYTTELMGGEFIVEGDYPEWEFEPHSKLRSLLMDIYEEMYSKQAVVETIHAGVECGIFAKKMPGIDIVSIGPDMYDIHTPNERLCIESVQRTYAYVCRILERFKDIDRTFSR